MQPNRKKMRLYAITDRSRLHGRSLTEAAASAIEGGATMIQLREKQMEDGELLRLAEEIRKTADRYGVPLIVNDRPDIAEKCGAAGVHIGQSDGSVQAARRILGEDKIIGVSAHSVEEALRAEEAGADYLGVGALFSTSTKADTTAVTPETLQAICSAVSIPVVAIGGITADRIPLLRGTGIDGVAVVSAIFAEENPEKAAQKLISALDSAGIGEALPFSGNFAAWMEGIEGAIFDVDGTILDSMKMWRTVASRFLKKNGIAPPDGIDELMFRITLEEAAGLFKEKYRLSGSPEDVKADILSMVEDDYRFHLVCKPGVAEVIRGLFSRGIPLCIATATDRELVEPALERLGLAPLFRDILTCGALGVSKRSPDIYLRAAERIGTSPEKTLVFEDVLHAARSAASAGFPVVAIYDDNSASERSALQAVSSLYLESFEDWPG